MPSFLNFLNTFDPERKGAQFEHFVKWFLKNDPEWSTQVEQIWLWDEYPDRWGPDCGIDLIFRHKNNDVWAVQAKCYSTDYPIKKSDIDTFLSESNRPGIDRRLLITSTDRIGKNAKQVCTAQDKQVTLYLLSDFEQSAIEYPDRFSDLQKAKRKKRPAPRPHQKEAIKDVVEGFSDADRGQLIMACGTGKTFTTLWIKEKLSAKTTLVLLPSLSLLSQTLREWILACNEPFDVLCVCSDETVGKRTNEDAIVQSVIDISFPVTSDVDEISQFLRKRSEKVIFSTYQSSPLIAESQSIKRMPKFDLVIADEAHRCAGQVGNAFTTVLDQSQIKAKKRLFTTATPRTYSANLKKSASERGVDVVGMDDESIFGEVLHSLPFGNAIEKDLLTDYQVLIIGVDEPMVAEWIQEREIVQTESGDVTDAKSLASQIGLIKALKDYDLKRVISFHSRVKRAESFASNIQNTIDFVNKKHRPEGEICTDYVSGKMSTHQRRIKLDQLKSLSSCDRGLLSNAKCLSEGVDVPTLDGVAFIDPRGSQVDIVQAVGRAIRLSKDKTVGTIVLPVFIEHGENPELSIQSSNFKPVWNVLNALKSHDELLSFELDRLRTNLGKGIGLAGSGQGLSKTILDLPITVGDSFADSLRTYLVEKTTSSWNFWFGLLEGYVQEKGNARVPGGYKTAEGYKLGRWVSKQRSKLNQLPTAQKTKLESLEGWVWKLHDFQWEQGFSHLKEFVEQEGHTMVPLGYETEDGFNLGSWVSRQRTRQDRLTTEQKKRLESLNGWVWDTLEFLWDQRYSYLKEFVEKEGHARVPRGYISENGFNLGSWVGIQRNTRDRLTTERKEKLESLAGWVWDVLEDQWERGFSQLKQFIEQEGHARVLDKYITSDGFNLGSWVGRQRTRQDRLTTEQKKRLESLAGWVWDVLEDQWERGFSQLKQFIEQEGHARVPRGYKTEDGFNLGNWVGTQRNTRDRLTTEQKEKLESFEGWVWDPYESQWDQGFSHLKQFVEQEGHARVPQVYETEDGFRLGSWVGTQRNTRDRLTTKQKKRLESLAGWVWDVLEDQWNQGFSQLKHFVEQEGHARVPRGYKTEDGFRLSRWVSKQRINRYKLTRDRISRLESLQGWVWNPHEFQWEHGYKHLQHFVEQHGHARVPSKYKTDDGFKLGNWVNNIRSNQGRLTTDQKSRLEALEGWVWDVLEYQWNQGFSHLKQFVEQEGHARVPRGYKTENGLNLGRWVSFQRSNQDKLTPERISKLNSLGFWWG